MKCPPHQTILYSNKLIKKFRIFYDENLRIYSDSIFTSKFIKHFESYTYLPFALVDFKEGGLGNSIKGSKFRMADQIEIFLKYRKNLQGFICLLKNIVGEIVYTIKLLLKN